ncbi:MAG: sulfotransferase [Bacteroidota bacterium]
MARKSPRFVIPALGNRRKDWKALLQAGEVDPPYRIRKQVVGLVTGILGIFRAYETAKIKSRLEKTQIHERPIFILGHWRSGTTYLHNLLSMDERFGYLTNVQALFPHVFMSGGIVRWGLKVFMPATRPMDKMPVGLHTPQEEDLALLNHGPTSYYKAWVFPREYEAIYDETIALKDPADEKRWAVTYRELLRKISLNQQERPLVLKNPANTGRIPTLIRMFPQAKFIHIHRDPYEVYGSSKKLLRRAGPYFNLQEDSETQLRERVVNVYRRLMRSYLEDRKLIPPGQLVEVKYEDFVAAPMSGLEQIYRALDLFSFGPARAFFQSHLKETRGYRVSQYELPSEEKQILDREWDFVPPHWYAQPLADAPKKQGLSG